jgi:hypothetical protein
LQKCSYIAVPLCCGAAHCSHRFPLGASCRVVTIISRWPHSALRGVNRTPQARSRCPGSSCTGACRGRRWTAGTSSPDTLRNGLGQRDHVGLRQLHPGRTQAVKRPPTVQFVDHQQRAALAAIGPPAEMLAGGHARAAGALSQVRRSQLSTVNAADRIVLGRLVLPVDSDALGQLAQRRGSRPFRGEQVPGHRTGQGLMAHPVRRHPLGGQQQRESLLLLA